MSEQRPSSAARSELRRTIQPWDTSTPLISADPFNLDADLIINGEEYIHCTSRSEHWLLGCDRGLKPEEGGVAARKWLGGTPVDQITWTAVEIVTEIPTPTLAMVGRQFVYRDANGNTYSFNVVISPEGEPVIDWVNEPPADANPAMTFGWASLITGLTRLYGVALDASGNIYTLHLSSVLRKYNSTLVQQWSQTVISGGNHVASDGTTVFAADAAGHVVHKRLASTGAAGSPASFGSLGSGDGQFGSPNSPIGVCFDGTNVWVVDAGNNRVQKFLASTGAYVSQFAIPAGSTGICLGPSSTHLYILCAGAGEVRKHLKSDHSLVSTFTLGLGNAEGQIGTTAEGIGVDVTGRNWIADTPNHRINVYDATGVFIASFGEFGSGDEQFKSPKQLAFNATGTMAYIADSGNGRLVSLRETDPAQLELGYYAYDWDEEFIGGGTASGAIGERGWTFNGNGGVSVQASTATNPGLIRVTSGATNGNSSRVTLGPWVLPQVDSMTLIFFPASNTTTGNMRVGAGMGVALNVASPTEGVVAEYDSSIGANMQLVKYAGSVATRVDTGIAFVANRQYLLELTVSGSGIVDVRLKDLVSTVESTTTFTGVSTTAQFDASFYVRTTSNANKSIDPDYWSGSFSGLSRA